MARSKAARPSVVVCGGGDVDLDRDRTLVLRCQQGDGAAFAELYTQYFDRLHRFCVRRLLDPDEADEVTQEAFLRAWRALPSFAGGLRFYPWLSVIAKNLCTDVLRRRARYGTLHDFDRQSSFDTTRLDPFTTTMSSEDAVMASFDGDLAAEALARLSDRHRHVLRLREEAGLSYQEIANVEGVEISTVETLLWRARQALKREYAALSGTRVLGGLVVAGAAVRRLAGRLARRTVRLALSTSRVRLRDVAAAGLVTVALATVTGGPAHSARAGGSPPVGVAPRATTNAVGTGLTTPAPPGSATTPPAPPVTPPSGFTGGVAPSSNAPSSPVSGLPVPAAGLSTLVGQLPTLASQLAAGLGAALGQITQTPTLLPPVQELLGPTLGLVSSPLAGA